MAETWVVARVCDLRSREVRALALGELREVYREGLSIGSDDLCSLVLDASAVEPRHARAWAASNHRYLEALCPEVGRFEVGASTLPVGERVRVDGRPFRVGCFTVTLLEIKRTEIGALMPVTDFDARLGGARAGAPSMLPPDTTSATEAEARVEAFCRTLASMDRPWPAPSPAQARSFAEVAVRAHVDRLSQATSPRAPLAPGQVTVVSSAAELLSSWQAAWARAERPPVRPFDWTHVHRIHALAQAQEMASGRDDRPWTPTHTSDEVKLSEALWHFERSAGAVLTGSSATFEPVVAALHALALAQVHALQGGVSDRASPWLPLLALWEKGIWPFALPAGGMLIWCASASDAPLPALAAPAPAAAPALAVGKVERAFPMARAVLLARRWTPADNDAGKPSGPPIASGSMPAGARLERLTMSPDRLTHEPTGETLALRKSSHLSKPEGARNGLSQDPTQEASLTFVDGLFWLTPPKQAGVNVEINGRMIWPGSPRPLFDGDLVAVGDYRGMLHYRLRYDEDADCEKLPESPPSSPTHDAPPAPRAPPTPAASPAPAPSASPAAPAASPAPTRATAAPTARTPRGAPLLHLDAGRRPTRLAFLPGGYLVTGASRVLRIFELPSGRLVDELDGELAAVTPYGHVILHEGEALRELSWRDGKKRAVYRLDEGDFPPSLQGLCSPDGEGIVLWSKLSDRLVHLDRRRGRAHTLAMEKPAPPRLPSPPPPPPRPEPPPLRVERPVTTSYEVYDRIDNEYLPPPTPFYALDLPPPPPVGVCAVLWTPDSRRLVALDQQGQLSYAEAPSGLLLGRIRWGNAVTRLLQLDGGRPRSLDESGTVRLWRLDRLDQEHPPERRAVTRGVMCAASGPGAMALCSHDDARLRWIDLSTSKVEAEFSGYRGLVRELVFDGARFGAGASDEGGAHVWAVEKG